MANKRIYELTSDIGVAVVDNDLFAVDKYVGPGSYTTVFKNATNVRDYVSSYVTALSTVSFSNINTSINAVKPDIYDELELHGVVSVAHQITHGSSFALKAAGIYGTPFAGRALVCHVKMFAYSLGSDTVAIGEYRVSLKSSGPSILSQVTIYEDEEVGISINASSFSTGTDGSGIYIQTNNNHTLTGETVRISMTVETYGHNL